MLVCINRASGGHRVVGTSVDVRVVGRGSDKYKTGSVMTDQLDWRRRENNEDTRSTDRAILVQWQRQLNIVRTAEVGGDIANRISESITCRGYQRVADLGRDKDGWMRERVTLQVCELDRKSNGVWGYLLSEISRSESTKSPARP